MSLSAALPALAFVAGGYAIVLLALYVFQRRLLYLRRGHGTPVIDKTLLPRARAMSIQTTDGELLLAWIIEPAEGRPVLLYLPGALDDLSQRMRQERFAALTKGGLGLLAIDYRGYGASTGTPSETGFHHDARAAYEIAARLYAPGRVVIYGESMGTTLATALAGKVRARALVLEAPMLSMRALIQRRLPFVPVGLLLKDALESDTRIAKISKPLLIVHGARDRVVPISHGRRLFEKALEPKRFVTFAKGNHVDLPRHGLAEAVEAFLADHPPQERSARADQIAP